MTCRFGYSSEQTPHTGATMPISVFSFFVRSLTRTVGRTLEPRLPSLIVLLIALCLAGATAQASDDHSINLRLFGKNVIEDYNGCHIAFWQANKVPGKDRFSYVFFAPFNDGEELPAWMKVGKSIESLTRQDSMQAAGRQLEDLRLYRSNKGTYTVLIEVLQQREDGDNLLVDKGRLTITRRGFFPFVISVKGGIICPRMDGAAYSAENDRAAEIKPIRIPANLYGDPITLGRGAPFNALSQVPSGVLQSILRDAPDCDPANTTGAGMRYAVSSAMSLWEVPCNLYARAGSSVFVTALNENPDWSNVLLFPSVPDHGDGQAHYEVRSAEVKPANALVTSAFYDGDGSCGSFEAYQLRAVEGEALEFFLIEYREKPSCDGQDGDARGFPLVYRVR